MFEQTTELDWQRAAPQTPAGQTQMRRMRRSPRVVPSLLATAAAISVATALAGCSDNQNSTPTFPAVKARCVDQNGNVLADAACVASPSGRASAGGAHASWVYGGGGGDTVGSRATGYTTTAPAEGNISTSSGHVVRGGFGGEGAAHGAAGESGAGGESGAHGGGGEGGHGGGGGGGHGGGGGGGE